MAVRDSTPVWTVIVAEPRVKSRERWLRCVARLREVGGKCRELQLCTKTLDRAKAEIVRSSWERDLNAPPGAEPTVAPGDLVFIGLVDARLRSFVLDPETSPNTVRSYTAFRKALKGTKLARVRCAELRVADVLSAQVELVTAGAETPRKASTVRLMLGQAAAVWRWALDHELVTGDWPRVPRRRALPKVETDKRPYTDLEVGRVLAWARDYEAGRWLPVFQLLADTGHRIGEVLGLHGKDVTLDPVPTVTFRGQWVRGTKGKPSAWRAPKTKAVIAVAIPVSTAGLLPRVRPEELLFPNERDRSRPTCIETVRDQVQRALTAIGVTDPENLDTHSLRRAWVTTAKRQGIADAVGMQITGHKERKIYDGYGRNAIGDDLRGAVQTVHDARNRAVEAASTAASTTPIAQPLRTEDLPQVYDLTS